ncbi:MAG: hypothetical protein DRP42_07110 [Tenericutes bacterium]|nr:MAG: hypothetical protein DRP42_07110 [Mycoplasmatota bacterium]
MAFSIKRSEAMKRRWENPEYRKKKTDAFLNNNPMDKKENREKVSQSLTGRKRPEIAEQYKGEGNPNYKNGIVTGKRMVLEVRQLCEDCNADKDLHVHHLDKDRTNNQFNNLRLLCRSCHSKEHRGNIEWYNTVTKTKGEELLWNNMDTV